MPSGFTPNNDGLNDLLKAIPVGIKEFRYFRIYNRWGQKIFETTNLTGSGWDGKFNDVPQPEGVYVYMIDATFKDGQKEHRQGNVTLLR